MEKIDKRRHYVLMLDTETANSIEQPFVYDLGWAVIDTKGYIYRTRQFLVADIFLDEKELMQSAYYAEKIPLYWERVRKGEIVLRQFANIRKALLADMAEFEISEVCAHNARFDVNALNTTQRWLTKSKYRFFFPFGTEIWDTMRMAENTICQQKLYRQFCERNGYLCKNGTVRKTAEILFRYINCDTSFIEEHTSLADVLIETQILAKCFRQHKPMRKNCFNKF